MNVILVCLFQGIYGSIVYNLLLKLDGFPDANSVAIAGTWGPFY